MINNTFCIGIGGLAKAGKDTLCNLLVAEFNALGLKAKRFALADDLKLLSKEWILKETGIDVLKCTAAEKEIVRPYLVSFGKDRRQETEGTFWTKRLEEKITKESDIEIAIIPDIRYAIYEKDENFWIKQKIQGLLTHVSRFKYEDGRKIWIEPPNEDETKNDPLIRASADFSLSWETLPDYQLKLTYRGFLETIVACTYVEINRQTRYRTNL